MMGCTDRHARYLMRLLSRRALLYTEMIAVPALEHGDRGRLLAFNAEEHPIAVQIGGHDPEPLGRAAALAEAAGYDEINLNVGCPSARVQAGSFGARLMAEPDRVARIVEAMRRRTSVPITVRRASESIETTASTTWPGSWPVCAMRAAMRSFFTLARHGSTG